MHALKTTLSCEMCGTCKQSEVSCQKHAPDSNKNTDVDAS